MAFGRGSHGNQQGRYVVDCAVGVNEDPMTLETIGGGGGCRCGIGRGRNRRGDGAGDAELRHREADDERA